MHGFDMLGQVFGMAVFFPRENGLNLPTEAAHIRVRDAQSQLELTAIIDGLDRELSRELPGRERALDAQAGLLSVWLERRLDQAEGPIGSEKIPAGDQLAFAFTALLERDFRSGKTVSDYAAALGVTPTHLTRVCKQACGRPASRLVQDRVHYEARRLLSETDIPVNRIAKSLGFRSAAYFTRAFQSNTGTTPSEFRRKS
ncbi:MAG: helix-turn-helix transcriptional regulator [Pseudomonadota bacterium]